MMSFRWSYFYLEFFSLCYHVLLRGWLLKGASMNAKRNACFVFICFIIRQYQPPVIMNVLDKIHYWITSKFRLKLIFHILAG